MAIDRLLVPLDGSQLAEVSLSHAIRLARAYKSRLFLVQVLDAQTALNEYGPDDLDWRLYKLQAVNYLKSLSKRLAREGIEFESHVMEGRAPDQIMEFIRDWRIDLVVLCAYGRGGQSEFPFGGTAHKIVATSETSIMVVRPSEDRVETTKDYRRILVPVDGSQRAAWALSLVSGMTANNETPEIILLQVVGLPDMPRTRPLSPDEVELRNKFVECNRRAAAAYLEEMKKRFTGRLSIRTRLEVSPHVVDTIERVAELEDVDLIALTAHGASGVVGRISGTICQTVVMLASRPVLVFQDVPADYREEPKIPGSVPMERGLCAV